MKPTHSWLVTPKEAIKIQKDLRQQIILSPLKNKPKYIAGADVSMNLFSKDGFAGFIVLSYPDLEVVDHSVVKGEITFPYIPGLLSFREIPLLMDAWKKIKIKPDLIVVDGNGILHPRRLGIATHLGIILGVPTIGCAKSQLTGEYIEPDLEAGSSSLVYDKFTNEIIGSAVRSKKKVKPIFVSPGHKVTLDESIKYILNTTKKYRLPEPTRLAHAVVNEYRMKG